MLMLFALCGCDEPSQIGKRTVSRVTKQPLTVNAIELERVSSTVKTATFFGTLEPNRQAFLGFGIAGNIDKLAAVGDRFSKDGQIAVLDTTELRQQRTEIEERIEAAKTSQQIQQVPALEAQLKQVEASISASQITAPYDCAIAEVFSFQTGLVEGKKPVLKVVELAQPNVKIDLPRRVARWIEPETQYFFVIANSLKQGTFLRKSVTESSLGSSTFWFELNDVDDVEAAFGMTVECRFNLRIEQTGFWIPITALNRSGKGIWSVMVVEQAGEQNLGSVVKRLVQVTQFEDNRVLIDGPVNPGDLVIADGIHRIVSGQRVEINTVRPDSSVASNPGSVP